MTGPRRDRGLVPVLMTATSPGRMLLDTSAVTSDVIAALPRGQDSSLLAAMSQGTCRGFMAMSVAGEVPRVLGDRARESDGGDFDLGAALDLWRTRYLPVLQVVDTTGLPGGAASEHVAGRDVTDAPTAALAELLSEVVVIASDGDVKILQPAATRWQQHRADLGTIHKSNSLLEGAGLVTVLTGTSVKAMVRAAARYPLPTLVAVAAGLAFAVRNRDRLVVPAWMPELAKAAGQQLSAALGERAEALDRWRDNCFTCEGDGLLYTAARILARAPEPMSRTQLARALREQDPDAPAHRTLMMQLEELLASYPAFCRAPRSRWQLGSAGAAAPTAHTTPRT